MEELTKEDTSLSQTLPPDCDENELKETWKEKKAKTRISNLFQYSLFTDVNFLVGPERIKISAHKAILASASPVFYKLFYRSLPTSNDIEIPDIDPESFRAILRFIYSDDLLLFNDVLSLRYAAKKYMIIDLVILCSKKWYQNMNPNNCLQAYQQALIFGDYDLCDICWYFIVKNIKEVLISPKFVNIDKKLLLKIVSESQIEIHEFKLYEAVMKWAKAVCVREKIKNIGAKVREILGSVIFAIRFPLMSSDEFLTGPVRECILKKHERQEIINFFREKKLPQQYFKKEPRKYITIELQFKGQKEPDSRLHGIKFTSNSKLLLISVEILEILQPVIPDETILYLEDEDSGAIYDSKINYEKCCITSEGDVKKDQIESILEFPLIIKPKTPYLLYILKKETGMTFTIPVKLKQGSLSFEVSIASKNAAVQISKRNDWVVMRNDNSYLELASAHFFKLDGG